MDWYVFLVLAVINVFIILYKLLFKVIKTMTDRGETRDLDIEEYILQGAVPKHPIELYKDKEDHNDEERMLIQQLSKDDYDEEYLLEKISTLQLRLDDAQKIIQLEKE